MPTNECVCVSVCVRSNPRTCSVRDLHDAWSLQYQSSRKRMRAKSSKSVCECNMSSRGLQERMFSACRVDRVCTAQTSTRCSLTQRTRFHIAQYSLRSDTTHTTTHWCIPFRTNNILLLVRFHRGTSPCSEWSDMHIYTLYPMPCSLYWESSTTAHTL